VSPPAILNAGAEETHDDDQSCVCHSQFSRVHVMVDTVRRLCHRFHKEGIACLKDRCSGGRPRKFPPVPEVKELACAKPAEKNVLLSRWLNVEVAREAVTRGIVDAVTVATVRRRFHAYAIQPWQIRSWIFSPE
jgi:hypothetical protein